MYEYLYKESYSNKNLMKRPVVQKRKAILAKNSYLYGKDIEVPEFPADIVMRRTELLKDHLAELLEHSFYTRDCERVAAILKAIDWHEDINKQGT